MWKTVKWECFNGLVLLMNFVNKVMNLLHFFALTLIKFGG